MKYKHVGALTRQINVPQLNPLLARYLNLSEDLIHRCRIRVWKSLELKVELMPWQAFQVEIIQRVWCTVNEA